MRDILITFSAYMDILSGQYCSYCVLYKNDLYAPDQIFLVLLCSALDGLINFWQINAKTYGFISLTVLSLTFFLDLWGQDYMRPPQPSQ
jgi:hypothetical protein